MISVSYGDEVMGIPHATPTARDKGLRDETLSWRLLSPPEDLAAWISASICWVSRWRRRRCMGLIIATFSLSRLNVLARIMMGSKTSCKKVCATHATMSHRVARRERRRKGDDRENCESDCGPRGSDHRGNTFPHNRESRLIFALVWIVPPEPKSIRCGDEGNRTPDLLLAKQARLPNWAQSPFVSGFPGNRVGATQDLNLGPLRYQRRSALNHRELSP